LIVPRFLELIKSDYARHEHNMREPGVAVLANHRVGQVLKELPFPLRPFGDAVHKITSMATEFLTGSYVSRDVEFGDAPHLLHALNVRIAPGVKFGARCGVMHEVTIGPAHGKEGVPTIGDDVFIAVGATIRGPVKIGNGVIIGALSVVTEDVPDGVFVMGNPARKVGWPTTHVDDRGRSK
jgi:serine O-acetyltransferase